MARINKNKVLDAARRAVEKGQTDRAIREYEKVVHDDPKDVRVWLKIGDLYARKGNKQQATETYLKVATFYSEQGFYLKAVAVYKQILKLDPRLVEINLKLAELYRQLGLLSDAMQHFEMVAAFFHREGKTREAMATIRQLVDLDPENVATRIKLAELYSKEAMNVEAVNEFSIACDYLRTHNRFDDFVKVAERLLWHKQDNYDLARELATLYLRRNDPRRALQKLQSCFKANARDVETLALLAQAFQALDQKSKTVSVLKELARILAEDGQHDRAAEVHRKILSFAPDDAESMQFLGLNQAPVAQAGQAEEVGYDVEEEFELPDFPARPPSQYNMGQTGSMPLVDAPSELPIDFGEAEFGAPQVAGFAEPEFEAEEYPQHEEYVEPETNVVRADDFVSEFALKEEPSYKSGSAGGEANADEIIKILTETDVYVKYGLHQKAIDHLRRVFDLDPENIEARERLKDILLSRGRESEAVPELLRLAEQTGSYDPERAEGYLRQVLEHDPMNRDVGGIADRYNLDVSDEPDLEIVAGDSVVEYEVEVRPESVAPEPADDFSGDDFDFEFDLDTGGGTPVREVEPIPQIESNTRQDGAFDVDGGGFDSLDFDSAMSSRDFEDAIPIEEFSDIEELDEADLIEMDDSDVGIPTQDLGGAAAEVLQAASAAGGTGVTVEVSLDQVEQAEPLPEAQPLDFGEEAAPSAFQEAFGRPSDSAQPPFVRDASDTVDPAFAGESTQADSGMPADMTAGPTAETQSHTIDGIGLDSDSMAGGNASALEDDLDEADFFVAQGLFDEARDILSGLLERYPNHPLVTAKMQDVEQLIQDSSQVTPVSPIGDVDFEAVPAPVKTKSSRPPTVTLEKPVDDEDADTHYDLGLACKEMGLYDEAVKAFNKVKGIHGREVQCHLMIGLCFREQGNVSEAINEFKAGLYVDPISVAERFGLYYEIGSAYEVLGDPQEALYYFEMVSKKDPNYRDIAMRTEALRSAGGIAVNRDADTGVDHVAVKGESGG